MGAGKKEEKVHCPMRDIQLAHHLQKSNQELEVGAKEQRALISAFACMSTVKMTKTGCVFSIINISCFFENCSNTCHKTYLKACACCVRAMRTSVSIVIALCLLFENDPLGRSIQQ